MDCYGSISQNYCTINLIPCTDYIDPDRNDRNRQNGGHHKHLL